MVALPNTVNSWLKYIESLHPSSIEMGLVRVREVANRLSIQPQCPVITVGGTNGKGSTCAMLERSYLEAGYRVACYTSPHLQRYQERVRINGQEVDDDLLCQAFLTVEQAREKTSLTYFEIGTLSALWVFAQTKPDVAILEVGLGGRLDAVNIIDADCAIVTNVDMDHMEHLGNSRDEIGIEKAGIYRAQQISICGDIEPPKGLLNASLKSGVKLIRNQIDFQVEQKQNKHYYRDAKGEFELNSLSLIGDYQWHNAASVIYAIRALQHRLPVELTKLQYALQSTTLLGRFQYCPLATDVILDVAHNPHAAQALFRNLQALKNKSIKIKAVFSMLADKDIAKVVKILLPMVDTWAIAPIQHPRACSIANLHAIFGGLISQGLISQDKISSFSSIPDAFQTLYKSSDKDDKILVFGSFFTVAAVLDDVKKLLQTSHH